MKFLRYLLLFLLSFTLHAGIQGQNNYIIVSNPAVEQSNEYLIGNNYQKDLLLFLNMLESTHPAFSPNLPAPFQVEEVRKKGYEWARNCSTDSELWNYLQSIVSALDDGHTSLAVNYNRSDIFPFMFYPATDGYHLFTITQQHASSLGKKIVKINNHPIQTVIESFRPLFSCNNDIDFNKKIRKQISFEVLWTNNPYKSTDSLLHLTFDDGSTIGIEPRTADSRDLVALKPAQNLFVIRQRSNDPFLYRILKEQSICYLQFNVCEDQSSLRVSLFHNNRGLTPEQIEQSLTKYLRFDNFLNNMFEEIEANDIKTLVVDVRNNAGGNSSLCEILLSWLKPIEEQVTGTSKIRFSTLWEKHYPQIAADYKRIFTQNNIAYRTGELYENNKISQLMPRNENGNAPAINYNELFIKNRNPDKIFKGNVIFLQDDETYSSAGQLITDAIDNQIGIVLGSESSFTPCHYGDMLAWELPNTFIKGTISHKYFARPDSSRCYEKSIHPVIPLNYTWDDILQGNDIYWNWILTMYGNIHHKK